MADTVDFDTALKMLPDREEIHTFRQCGSMLFGADWPRASILEIMESAESIALSGPMAERMNHKICIQHDSGHLFIETIEETK